MLKNGQQLLSFFRQSTYLKLFLLAAFSTLLNACSTAPTISSEQSSKPRVLQEQVQLTGRISIQYQQREQAETISAGFEWQQAAHDLHISLSSPLGQTIATIQQTPMGARLEQAKQEPRTAADIEQLLADSLGWSIPVIGLKGWLQGFDVQANGKNSRSASSRLFPIASPRLAIAVCKLAGRCWCCSSEAYRFTALH